MCYEGHLLHNLPVALNCMAAKRGGGAIGNWYSVVSTRLALYLTSYILELWGVYGAQKALAKPYIWPVAAFTARYRSVHPLHWVVGARRARDASGSFFIVHIVPYGTSPALLSS